MFSVYGCLVIVVRLDVLTLIFHEYSLFFSFVSLFLLKLRKILTDKCRSFMVPGIRVK